MLKKCPTFDKTIVKYFICAGSFYPTAIYGFGVLSYPVTGGRAGGGNIRFVRAVSQQVLGTAASNLVCRCSMGGSCATSGLLVDLTFDLVIAVINVMMADPTLSGPYLRKYWVQVLQILYAGSPGGVGVQRQGM